MLPQHRPITWLHHITRRTRVLACVAAVALAAIAGCRSSSSTASQPSTSPVRAAPYVVTGNVPVPGKHLYIPRGRYVALGDSFSSGEGVPPFHPETDTADTCHRSSGAYSQILQQVSHNPDAPMPQSDKDFVACSGATTQALWHRNDDNRSEQPQLDRLSVNATETNGHAGGPVGLITISMGGNDVGFSDIIKACTSPLVNNWFYHGSCNAGQQHKVDVNLHWIDGTYSGNAPAGPACGPGCNPYKACPPGSGCNPENLVQVYRALRQKAPRARILVLGYPREFRPSLTASQSAPYSPNCQHVGPADQDWANTHLTDALDNVIQSNIKAANAGIEYVDTVPYFLQHEQWCHWTDPDSAFNGYLAPKLGTDYEGYFHPNASGQRLLAQAVLDKLSHPAPATTTTRPMSPSPSATPTTPATTLPAQATVVKTFEPWVAVGHYGGSAPLPGLVVTNGGTATCDSGSSDDPGSAVAVRCTPPGNGAPCYINDTGGGDPGSPLLCSTDPTSKQVTEITPAGPDGIPAGMLNPGDPSQPPWFLILADGRKCHFLGYGTNTDVLGYDCGNDIGATVPDRSTLTWTVREGQLQADPAPSPARVAVVTAYRGKTAVATASASPAPTPAITSSATAVVEDYYAAVNAHDYQRAWSLGGKNLSGSYGSFVQGFANTAYDSITVASLADNTVIILIDSTQTDGTHEYFTGSYTVQNNEIVSAKVD
jgi:lysophospholipase L1-like esterase